jgi:alkyl hydroperoxide reductase subunit D
MSAINGCGMCVDSHERVLREKGVNEETILAAVRIAAGDFMPWPACSTRRP